MIQIKATGILCEKEKERKLTSLPSTSNAIDEKVQAKDELSALVFTRMLLARFNIEVSPKTVTNAAQTWLENASDAKY